MKIEETTVYGSEVIYSFHVVYTPKFWECLLSFGTESFVFQFDIQKYYVYCFLIYLLTAIGLTPGGSSAVHIYTQTVHRTTQITNLEECGPCPVFASFTLAFALQLRKKHGKTSVRVAEEERLRHTEICLLLCMGAKLGRLHRGRNVG